MQSIEKGIERISYKQSPTQEELHTIFVNIRAQWTHCVIVGEWIMGAKAENLLKYAEEICDAWFFMKPMVILTDECFAEMLSLDTYVMENPDKSEHILSVDKKLRMFLEEIHTYFASENVLFVRSSAVWDSAGTGVRESHRGKNTITLLEENIKRVLASDLTDQAKQFRKDAGIDEGLATIIMPIVGNNYHNIFAPCISGYAFTNQFQNEFISRCDQGLAEVYILSMHCVFLSQRYANMIRLKILLMSYLYKVMIPALWDIHQNSMHSQNMLICMYRETTSNRWAPSPALIMMKNADVREICMTRHVKSHCSQWLNNLRHWNNVLDQKSM